MEYNNQAAWLDGPGRKLRVSPADMPKAGEGEIVVRNRAITINPVSWKIQDTGVFAQTWPVILDMDVAGEVHEVGAGVSAFRKGDRVLAFVEGPMNPDTRHGAYQLYSIAKVTTVAKLPDRIPFAEGCILPLAFNTALVSLCAPPGRGFGLPLPKLDPMPSRNTIIIWGASSAVGLLALQLAKAAGIKAIAVASAHNRESCMACGAIDVFDYHEQSIVSNLVDAVGAVGGNFVGILDCVSSPDQSLKFCISILEQLGGGQLGVLRPDVRPEVPESIKVTNIFGVSDMTHAFWESYITPALEQGKLRTLPQAIIVGEGLRSLQNALDVQRKGISAKKVVVTLD